MTPIALKIRIVFIVIYALNKTFALFKSISYSLCSYVLPSQYSKVWTQALKNLCCLQYNNCKKSGSLSSQSLEAQALCLYSSQFIFFSCSIAINYNVKQKSPTLKAELFCFRAIIRNDSPKTLKKSLVNALPFRLLHIDNLKIATFKAVFLLCFSYRYSHF